MSLIALGVTGGIGAYKAVEVARELQKLDHEVVAVMTRSARKFVGEDIVDWMKKNVHPLDIVFRLAEEHGIVLLNGGGFAAPDWSVRISFANLDDHVYDDIGRAVRAIARGYRLAYEAATGQSGQPAGRKGSNAKR